MIEAVMARDLEAHHVMDPDLADQAISPRRALRELERIRSVELSGTDGRSRKVITRPGLFQKEILVAFEVDTSSWRSQLSA